MQYISNDFAVTVEGKFATCSCKMYLVLPKKKPSHPFPSAYPVQGHSSAGAHPRARGRAHPQTPADTQPFTLTFTANLQSPINLIYTHFLDCGRKLIYQKRTHTLRPKDPTLHLHPGPHCCEVTVLSTTLVWGSDQNAALNNKCSIFMDLPKAFDKSDDHVYWVV